MPEAFVNWSGFVVDVQSVSSEPHFGNRGGKLKLREFFVPREVPELNSCVERSGCDCCAVIRNCKRHDITGVCRTQIQRFTNLFSSFGAEKCYFAVVCSTENQNL